VATDSPTSQADVENDPPSCRSQRRPTVPARGDAIGMPNGLVRDGAALRVPVRTDLDGWHFRLRLAGFLANPLSPIELAASPSICRLNCEIVATAMPACLVRRRREVSFCAWSAGLRGVVRAAFYAWLTGLRGVVRAARSVRPVTVDPAAPRRDERSRPFRRIARAARVQCQRRGAASPVALAIRVTARSYLVYGRGVSSGGRAMHCSRG
jgi:hypothetical protein